MDFCKFFADIESDPHAAVKITVGEYLQAAEHAQQCEACFNAIERTVAKGDQDPPPLMMGLN